MKPIKRLLLKAAFVIGLPPLVLLAVYLVHDPFKVLRSYDSYYGAPGEYPVQAAPNKGMVSIETYEHYRDSMRYDSYVIGSSISMAFFLDDWRQYLPADARPMHLWSSSQSIHTMRLFIDYLVSNNADIRNVLLVAPPDWFIINDDIHSPTHIRHPHVDPSVSWLTFHWMFLKSFYDRDFLRNYIMGKIYGHPVEASQTMAIDRVVLDVDPYTLQEYRPVAEYQIHNEPEVYYGERDFLFSGDHSPYALEASATEQVLQELIHIRQTLDSVGADYRLVMTPRYDMAYPDSTDSRHLSEIFGDRYTDLTRSCSFIAECDTNFYDPLHYRRHCAEIFLQRVYAPDTIEP